jgi:hypothetical protein
MQHHLTKHIIFTWSCIIGRLLSNQERPKYHLINNDYWHTGTVTNIKRRTRPISNRHCSRISARMHSRNTRITPLSLIYWAPIAIKEIKQRTTSNREQWIELGPWLFAFIYIHQYLFIHFCFPAIHSSATFTSGPIEYAYTYMRIFL